MLTPQTALIFHSVGTVLNILGLSQMKVTLQDTTGNISWFGQGPLSGRWLTGLLLVTVGCVLHVNAQPYGDMLMMASCCSIAVFTNAIWCIFYLKEKFTLSIDLISSLLICACGGLVAI